MGFPLSATAPGSARFSRGILGFCLLTSSSPAPPQTHAIVARCWTGGPTGGPSFRAFDFREKVGFPRGILLVSSLSVQYRAAAGHEAEPKRAATKEEFLKGAPLDGMGGGMVSPPTGVQENSLKRSRVDNSGTR